MFQHLYFEGVFSIQIGSASFKMEAHGDQVENDLFWRGYGNGWEAESLMLWRSLATSSEYIADVGANTGVYALAAQALNPAAKVLAVEPSARVFKKLKRNIDLNHFPISAMEYAASDASGLATFYDYPDDHQYSASLEPSMGGSCLSEVPVERLDDLLDSSGFEWLDLLKLDVERHEPSVLRGLSKTLQRCRPKMLIEILDDEMMSGVKQCLPDYRVEQVDERNYLFT